MACSSPNNCSSARKGYYISNGKATISCSLIAVSNCAECSSYTSCTKCVNGYTVIRSGAECQVTCNDTNCKFCPAGANVCKVCNFGFTLNDTTKACDPAFCTIDYCKTCASVQTCAVCNDGFTLSSDSKTCNTNCTSIDANCLFCNSTNCQTCDDGYAVNGTGCGLPCSISNCVTCYSDTQCDGCEDGYVATSDMSTCKQVCRVRYCSACPSKSSKNCSACEDGYSLKARRNGNNFCKSNCRKYEVNTGSNC